MSPLFNSYRVKLTTFHAYAALDTFLLVNFVRLLFLAADAAGRTLFGANCTAGTFLCVYLILD